MVSVKKNHEFVKAFLADFCSLIWRKIFQRDSVLAYFSTLCDDYKVDLTKKNFGEREFLVFPHCGVKIAEIYSHSFVAKSLKVFSSNQLFSSFFSHSVEKYYKKQSFTVIFFRQTVFTKIHEFRVSQMHVFTPLGGISKSNQWNAFCGERFDVKFIHNEVFKSFNLNISILLPNIGYFQKLITSSSFHLRQVF